MENIPINTIFNFWHRDSMLMYFVLKNFQDKAKKINLYGIVTIDERGEYIHNLIKNYGANCLRIPDGNDARHYLKDLYSKMADPTIAFILTLDGPLGPYKVPKDLAFKFAKKYNRPMKYLSVECTKKINLNKRWDKYVIPLPFTKINVEIIDINKKEDLLDK